MAIRISREYPDDRTLVVQIAEVHDGVVVDSRTLCLDTRSAPWADEWPPTAPPGVVMRLDKPIRCSTCNRVHEYMTKGCTPVLFGDNEEHGDMGLRGEGYVAVDPPEGLGVIVIPARISSDQDHYIYARVRHPPAAPVAEDPLSRDVAATDA